MDFRILQELGLSEAEAKIYVALLELGESKTGKIIDKTQLQSSTVYHVIGGLIDKGLVSFILKGKIKYFIAESPDSLMTFLDEKKRKLNEMLHELKERERLGKQHQTAKVYEGINGLKTAFNNILQTLKTREEYYFFQFPETKFEDERIRLFFRNFHLKRSEQGIKVKGLALQSEKHLYPDLADLPGTKIRYIKEFLPTGIVIYKDTIITLDWENVPTAFVIQSESVANSYKNFFEQKWKISQEF